MSNEAIALLIARMGIEFTIAFLDRSTKGTITVADLEELRTKYARSREEIVTAARAALGLEPA